jgi:hypothetical protein
MKYFLKTIGYSILAYVLLWLSSVIFSLLVGYSYIGHTLSWIPYLVLGGWIPWKWYGFNILHLIICFGITHYVIEFIDNKIKLISAGRIVALILVSLMFTFVAILNFFFRDGQDDDIWHFRQVALIQISFLIGILFMMFNPNTND